MKRLKAGVMLVGVVASLLSAGNIGALEKSCTAGDGKACYEAGNFYFDKAAKEQGGKDFVNSLKYYKKACGLGVADGCNMEATHYLKGLGVEKDPATAERLLKKSCDGGNSDACLGLGALYIVGQKDGFPHDVNNGLKFTEKSCELGNGMACYTVGGLYLNPKVTGTINFKKAVYFLPKACDLGVEKACKLMETKVWQELKKKAESGEK